MPSEKAETKSKEGKKPVDKKVDMSTPEKRKAAGVYSE